MVQISPTLFCLQFWKILENRHMVALKTVTVEQSSACEYSQTTGSFGLPKLPEARGEMINSKLPSSFQNKLK
jgi:hypothetical protein